MRSFKFSLAVVLLGVALTSCTQRSAVSYDAVADLREALSQEDVLCKPLDEGSGVGEAELVKDQGTCAIDDQEIDVFLFHDTETRDQWLALGGRLREATAVGPNWALIGEEEPVGKAAEALGAELRE